MDETKDSILIDGNTAAALGCLYAGATVGAWYPITPATSLMEAFKGFCQKYRREPETKQNRFAILQAEDELAADRHGDRRVAGPARARSRRPSGPGISLMNEFIGLAYYAEVPAVIFDVQRTGPSTGMPTRTQQGDLMMCAYASHGDTRHICLYPADPREAFEFAVDGVRPRRALPDAGLRAERSRHRHERLDGPEADVGRQLSAGSRQGAVGRASSSEVEDASTATSTSTATASRTARCRACTRRARTSRAAPATTASAPTPRTATSTSRCVDRIDRKIQRAARAVPAPIVRTTPGAKLGLVTVGGCHAACIEALDLLARGRHRARLHARPRLPVRRRGAGVPRIARRQLRRRAEPRRRSCAAC